MDRLQDKVVIVTGGARGIGAAFCKAVAGGRAAFLRWSTTPRFSPI